jgi:hypothetical protein
MDKSKLELLNVCTDLKRAVIQIVNNKNDSIFIKNILKNYSNLKKIDPNISKFIDINYLKNNSDSPKIMAENLLLQSVRLQHYLGF